MTLKTGANAALSTIDISTTQAATASLAKLDLAQQKVALSALNRAGVNTTVIASNLSEIASTESLTLAIAQESVTTAIADAGIREKVLTDIADTATQNAKRLGVETLTGAQLRNILATHGVSTATEEEIVTGSASAAVTGVQATAFDSLTVSLAAATKGILVFLATNPIGWAIDLVAVIAIASSAIDKKNEAIIASNNKVIESATTNIESYKSEITSLEDLSTKLQDTRTDRSQLLSVVGELNTAIGDSTALLSGESEAFDAASVKIQARIAELKDLTEAELASKIASQKSNFDVGMSRNWLQDATFTDDTVGLTVELDEALKELDYYKNFNQGGLFYDQAVARYTEFIDSKVTQAQEIFSEYIDQKFSDTVSQGYFDQYINDIIFGGTTTLPDIEAKIKEFEPAIDEYKKLYDAIAGATTDSEAANAETAMSSFLTVLAIEFPEATDTIASLSGGFYGLETAVTDSTGDAESSVLSLADAMEALSTAKDGISTLTKAFQELTNDKTISFDSLDKIKTAFADIPEIDNYISALAAANGSTEETSNILGTLAVSAINAKFSTDDLAAADVNLIAAMLNEAGVANGLEIATSMVAASKLEALLASNDLSSATWEAASAFLSEAGASKTDIEYLQYLREAKADAIIGSTNFIAATSDEIGVLLTQAKAAGLAAQSLQALSQIQTLKRQEQIGNIDLSNPVWKSTMKKLQDTASGNYDINFSPIKFQYTPSKSSGGSGGGGGSSSKAQEVEAYTIEIDKLYLAEKRLKDIQDEISTLQTKNDITANPQEQIKNLKQIIKLYENERLALREINAIRTEDINSKVATLTKAGFKISYDAETNSLIVKNKELINKLVAGKGKDQEATNNLRKEYEELIDTIEDENDANRENTDTWMELVKASKEAAEAIAEVYESLEDVIATNVEKTFDELSKLLDKEKEAFETQKSNLETTVSTVVSYINDQISALQDENDALDKQVELQEKLEALELAKTQRNKKVYREGVGFVYEADQAAINDAQKEYDSALRDNALEEQIKALQDAADAWQAAIDGYQQSVDEGITAGILGDNWQEEILIMSSDTIDKIASDYNETCGQLDETVEGSIASQIKNLETLSDEWEDMTDRIGDSTADYETILAMVSEYESGNYTERLALLQSFVDDSTAEYNKLAEAAEDALPKSVYDKEKTVPIRTKTKPVRGYAEGGVVNYTGIAAVHGRSAAEMMLNNADVAKVYDYIHNTPSLLNDARVKLLSLGNLSQYSNISPSSGGKIELTIGDIYVQGVNDVNDLANAIVKDLPSRILQKLKS